jgi:hypothetical protein
MSPEHVFDLHRIDVDASGDDAVRAAAGDPQQAVFVDLTEVARSVPAVRVREREEGGGPATYPSARVGPRTRISWPGSMRTSTPMRGVPTTSRCRRVSAGGAVATCDHISVIP